MRQHRACVGLVLCLLISVAALLDAKRLDAGPERFTLTCSSTMSGATPVVVPITITMTSDGPDYIDTLYSATDQLGNPVSCSPAGNRLYVAKGSPVIDNVSVSYTGANGPVTLQASGTGEVYGADNSACSCTITFTGYSSSPNTAPNTAPQKPKVAPAAATASTVSIPSDTAWYVDVVPVAIQLTGTSGWDQVTVTYAASVGTTKLQCVPASETFTLKAGVTPTGMPSGFQSPGTVIRHVAVWSKSDTATTPFALTVTAQGLAPLQSGTTTNTGTWTFSGIASTSLGQALSAPSTGTGNLAAGYAEVHAFKEHIVEVDVTCASGDLVGLRFAATDANDQTLPCSPMSLRVHDLPSTATSSTRKLYVIVNCDVSDSSSCASAAPITFVATWQPESSGTVSVSTYSIASP